MVTEESIQQFSALCERIFTETRKDMIGQEEVDFLHHLHVRPFPYAEEGSFTVYETRTEEGAVYRLDYLVTPDFVLTRS